MYHNFNNGFFTFQTTISEYSNTALDQIHKQNNTQIKGIGGASHILNLTDESALVRWELCAGDLSKMLLDFENNAVSPPLSCKTQPVRMINSTKIPNLSRIDFLKTLSAYFLVSLSILFLQLSLLRSIMPQQNLIQKW